MIGQRLHNSPLLVAGLGVLALVGALTLAGPVGASPAASPHARAQKGGGGSTQPPLVNGGGKLLQSSTTYAIWWGPKTGFPSDARTGIEALLGGFGGSSYLGIAAQYMPGQVAPTSTFGGSLLDTTTPPPTHSPSTAAIAAEVGRVIGTPDRNALYLVYTSTMPHLNFCAWHAAAVINGVQTQIAYLPNTSGVSGCDPGQLFDPPPNPYSEGTRSLADSTAHEFMESVTDPVPVTGWADKNGQEIGDKCNFVYDTKLPVTLANGSQWQIQEEWSNSANNGAGACIDGD